MKNIKDQIINGIAIVVMIFFAIPILLGKPQSIAGFNNVKMRFM